MYDFVNQIKVKSIPEQIAEQFKKEIINGKLGPGDKLPSLDELTKKLSVSKPTIREALQSLHESGLISTIKGRKGGYFVAEFIPDKLMKNMYEMIRFSLTLNKLDRNHLLEIRKMIEIPCASLAAERRTDKNIEDLKHINNLINSEKVYNTEELLQLDLRFHLSIAESTQNPLVKPIINAITKSFLESNQWNNENKTIITANTDKVIEAISKKDSKSAEIEMEKHMNYFLISNRQ